MSLDLRSHDEEREFMRVQEKALMIVAILALAALTSIACGASAAAVREVLATAIPAVTALALHSARRN